MNQAEYKEALIKLSLEEKRIRTNLDRMRRRHIAELPLDLAESARDTRAGKKNLDQALQYEFRGYRLGDVSCNLCESEGVTVCKGEIGGDTRILCLDVGNHFEASAGVETCYEHALGEARRADGFYSNFVDPRLYERVEPKVVPLREIVMPAIDLEVAVPLLAVALAIPLREQENPLEEFMLHGAHDASTRQLIDPSIWTAEISRPVHLVACPPPNSRHR